MNLTPPKILRIALFGTSADPPTEGHQAILLWLAQNYDQVAVWASNNPFKKHRTPLGERLKMLELLLKDITVPHTQITLREEFSDHRSLISLKRAQEIWGETAEYTIVVGADLVEQMKSWYKIEELLKKAKILIVPRAGYPLSNSELHSLDELGSNYSIAEFQVPAVSSTSYRQNGDDTLLTQSVAQYIKAKNLYQ